MAAGSAFAARLTTATGAGPLRPGSLRSRPGDRARRWRYLPYDQLHAALGPLATLSPHELGVVLIESPAKARRRPYHRQKLALVLANQRHFALELAARGVEVRYLVDADGYAPAIAAAARVLGPLAMMEAAERELRVELAPLVADGALQVEPHAGWLTTADEFVAWAGPRPPWRMDAFYRGARRASGLLMEGARPAGGKFSHDADNRRPWRGTPSPPPPPRFVPDELTREVGALVERAFASHPGQLDLEALPATVADAEALWAWALRACLPHFGPYEDAMSSRSRTLFHTLVSSVVNLHRVLPARVVADVAGAELPLSSQEGFIRQVLGWREFVRHVHVATDGFRTVSLREGAPLPPAFWGAPSGLACLDGVVADVWRTGYGHHITRLMVLSNLANLFDASPRELSDWFWIAYADAYDWVVEPNVLGMGTFAAGDLMTTKPYVAGAAYVHKMSDYCGTCAFDPRRTCPLTRLYWAFLDRHARALAGNQRMAVPLAALRKRAPAERARDAETFAAVRATLDAGATLRP
ncbi:MAG: cryptochrome/photolyase family protein [Kofleriaceae bacterium]